MTSYLDTILANAVKYFLIITIGTIFMLLSFSNSCFAQAQKDIEIVFTKTNDSIKSADLYFNVLKVRNNSPTRITGNLSFSVPEQWKIISFSYDQTTLSPGDSVLIPIRVSPASNAIGGISYIINATFRTAQQQVQTSTYVTLPSFNKWEFSTNKNNVYFTEIHPNTTFQIKLSNKGNTNELIKLKMDAGKLLAFTDKSPNDVTEYVTLRAFSDTIINHTITTRNELSFAEKLRYENNWRESAVSISASDNLIEKNSAIQFYKLNSHYFNPRDQSSSPLNIDYQIYNLMSNQPIRNNLKVYGSVLFPKNREIQYFAGLQNFSFDSSNEPFDYERQLIYNIVYTDNNNIVQLGYNINGGILHGINGRGISGTHQFNVRNSISYAATQNIYSKTFGEFVGYNTSLKKLSLSTQLTHEKKVDGSYEATSALLGAGINLFKSHFLSVQFLGSKSDFNKNLPGDTSVLGYSYRLNYNVRYQNFYLRFSTLSSEHNYIQNSGLQQSYLNSSFNINGNTSILLYGNRQKYAITRYPSNFYFPANYNSNDNLRLTTSFTSGNIIYQAGPNYTGSLRQTTNSLTGYKSEYITYQPGLWGAVSIKLGGYKSITPNITVSNIRFYYKTEDPSLENYSFDKNIFYSAGLNYFDNVWRVNLYYTSGSTTDLYRSVLVDARPSLSSSFQFRPSYENFFFDRKVKLSAYMNYAFYMPSGRENISFNIKYDQFFKKGWNLSVSGFMFTNTRVDKEIGRVTTKDLNLLIGITKSFNIQQPRQKYYDFKSVFFNDLNGDKVKSDNEPPVTDILVKVEKDQKLSPGSSKIQEIKLITDANGAVSIENLPKDNYKLTFTPQQNLESLYFINGSEQSYFNNKTQTMYFPLAESFKIKGRIILVRDPNSSEGKIDLGDIRIIATGSKGETYSALTDNSGAYIVSVPNADKYTVHINNVFGEQFNIDNNEMQVQFTQNKTINLDFTFIERTRGILFDKGGEMYNFKSITPQSETPALADSTVKEEEAQATPKSYAIQLSTLKSYRDPSWFKAKYKLKDNVLFTEEGGVYRYFTGDYPTEKAAKEAIAKLGLKTTPVAVDRSLLREALPVEKQQAATSNPATTTKESNIQQSVSQTNVTGKQRTESTPSSNNQTVVSSNSEAGQGENKGNPVSEAQRATNTSSSNSKPVVSSGSKTGQGESKGTLIPEQPGAVVTSPTSTESLVLTTKKTTVLPTPLQPTTVVNTPVSNNIPSIQKQEKISSKDSAENRQVEKHITAVDQPLVVKKSNLDTKYLYTINLDASRNYTDAKYYKEKYNLPFDVMVVVEKDGIRRFYTGSYETIDAAKADIARYGMAGYIVDIDESVSGSTLPQKK